MSSPAESATDNEAEIISKEEAITNKCKLFNGVYPTAKTTVANLFSAPLEDQIEAASKFAHYILNNTDEKGNAVYDFHALNTTDEIAAVPFIIPIAGTRTVRVVYGVGTGQGLNGILESDIDDNVMCMSGEVNQNVQMPDVLTLPSSAIFLSSFPDPGIDAVNKALQALSTKKAATTLFLLSAGSVKK